MENKILSYMHCYQNMGFECSFIEGNDNDMDSYKNPSCISKNISKTELSKYTGIGIHLGKNNEFRAIDIDDFHIQENDASGCDYSCYAIPFFIKKCMSLLGLPEDYEWLIRTPHGWHIIISAPSFGFAQTAYMSKAEFQPNISGTGSVIRLKTIELLWEGFLVMPPSNYGQYKGYEFYYSHPANCPARVGAAQILEFLCFCCGKYEYVTSLTDYYGIPIIGNAHLFPHYELNWDYGSQYYAEEENKENISENNTFLKACRNSLGFNMQGFLLVYNDLKKNYKVEIELDNAIKCFRMANDEWGHYNLACLMAIGALNGSLEEFHRHLMLSKGFPDEYKDQLKILYLVKNHSYEKYAIIDISTNERQRIEKVAILSVDAMGDIIRSNFISSEPIMENMYYQLEHTDYIVGCNLDAIKNAIKKECEISGYGFSEDMVGVNSDGSEYTVHFEGNFMDVFKRPSIDLPSIDYKETDPFRRIYKIKDLMVNKLKQNYL